MNKTYRSVWNAVTNTWTAAAETAKAHSKGSARAARQAVIAIALGGAAIGGAAAAEACTTEDGSSGTVDAAGVCKAAGDGAIGMMGTVGTMATDDTTFVKVNATANPASATGANAIAIGQTVTSAGSSSVAIGSNTTASGLHSVALGAGAKNADASDRQIAIGGQAQTAGKYTIAMGYLASATVEDALAFGRASSATSTGAVAIGAAATSGGTGSTAIGQSAAVVSSATNAVALGMNARVANSYSAAIGSNASAAGNYSSALGTSATSTGTASMALGGNSTATGNYSVAIGSATGMGRAAVATGTSSVAIGTTSSAGANNAVALGFGTVADRDNTVSVGAGVPNIDGNKFTRQIVNVAAGTEDNDAVNVGQMKTALSTKVDDTYVKIDTSNSTAAAQAGTAALAIGTNTSASGSYATAVGNSARASGNNSTALGFQASSAGGAAVAVGNGANASGSHGVALGVNAGASHTDSVALGASSVTDRDNSVSVGSSTLRRQITNVAAGTADTDAVNVAQMNAGLSTTNAAIAATNLNVSSLSTGLSSTNSTVAGLSTGLSSTNSTVAGLSTGLSSTNSTVAGLSTDLSTTNSTVAGLGTDLSTTNSTVAGLSTGLSSTNSTVAGLSTGLSSTVSTVAGHTKQIGDIDDKLSKLESGTTGLVQQANPGDDITVGANTDGNAVDFSSKTGARTLKGVAAGDVSATSTEAVNGSQLHGVSDSVASAIGGGATVNPDGSISAPVFTVGDGSGGTKIVNSVGEVVTNLDGRVTTNEGDIKKLADDIGSGTLGLVQQAKPGDDITVGANTDGNAVDFSSKTGARTLKGVAAGDVSATSTEAINGSQLHGVSDSVASAIGGGATVNPDGSISAPSFTVGDGSGGTKVVNSVGEVVTNLDGRVTTNEGDIKKLADDIGSGTLGLVQQAKPGDDITVGANTDGNAVDFSSKTGARTLKGVAAGDVSATSTEAVNGSQLHGVSDSVASAIGGGAAVNPDGSISAPSFTVGDGSGGTKVVNSVGEVVTNLDGRVTTNEGDIKKLADDIGSGTLGLVQQAKPGDDITVGANTDGNAVDFSSKTGARTLKGVAAGDVSATSTEAVNGSQLHGVSDSVASAIGGGAAVNPDGSISAPSFTVGDGSGGTKVVNSVGEVVTNLDGRVTTNEGDIKKLADDIGSGTLGLVQQAKPGDDITVGANTDGNAVDFSSKTG
ncbi:ESPR-type extended signal peptide-containing protein, partial [Burkholderia cenocepacia]|uniref:ESPR-type extended signal peptide-containing protein n=3 Tax=Burkholderia cenocepacia TaxID=95486 RepID=UPI0009B5C4B9